MELNIIEAKTLEDLWKEKLDPVPRFQGIKCFFGYHVYMPSAFDYRYSEILNKCKYCGGTKWEGVSHW
jgi:hypothetical protein